MRRITTIIKKAGEQLAQLGGTEKKVKNIRRRKIFIHKPVVKS